MLNETFSLIFKHRALPLPVCNRESFKVGLGGKGPLLCILGGSGRGAGCLGTTLATLARLAILLNPLGKAATAFFTGAKTLLPRSCDTGTMRIPLAAGLDEAEVDVGLGA